MNVQELIAVLERFPKESKVVMQFQLVDTQWIIEENLQVSKDPDFDSEIPYTVLSYRK